VTEYHVKLSVGEVGEYVFLPGDPGRVPLIASHLDDARHVVSNREFTTWTGSLEGTRVSVTSTGIGGPSTAIAVEELCNLGAHTFVRLGSAGAISAELKLGDVVVAQAAVREDGTTSMYAPENVPAVADLDVVTALREGAKAAGHECHIGTVLSSDGFYPGGEPARMPSSCTTIPRPDPLWPPQVAKAPASAATGSRVGKPSRSNATLSRCQVVHCQGGAPESPQRG